jgi:iron transport multicopper oxidase
MKVRRASLVLLPLALGCAPGGGPPDLTAIASAATVDDRGGVMAGDALRSGWYPDQALLDPTTVGSPYFGQLFDTPVDGQIYAQPLVAGGVLLVATETNQVYGLDPVTGTTLWHRVLGVPWRASDLSCADLVPTVGVTGTPAIDESTGTAYLLSKTYANGVDGQAIWLAHGLELATGRERPGFPVAIAGTASNDPTITFNPTMHMQRPGLLLMDGVVYAAFGAHCDRRPYTGWVVAVSTDGAVKTLWSAESGPWRTDGAGIWQSGGGLVSDGSGQILFATGNDWTSPAGPIDGKSPPGTLGEAIVRLSVQGDGTLAATDFFAPAELPDLNRDDADLGAGAPAGLPSAFGTTSWPDLLVHAGKSGYLYLLDRRELGGYRRGAGGGDRVLQRIGPFGGVWSKPSAWPGDGGYVYVPVVNGCTGPADPAGCLHAYRRGVSGDGMPTLSLDATSTNAFGYGSSAAVVTSDGTRDGSALVWTLWSSGWYGNASQLRAYDAVPENGTLRLRFLAGIGTSSKFTAPAVGNGRVYVGTRDGHVLGFGVTGTPPLHAEGVAFPPTTVGASRLGTVRVTATSAVTIAAIGIAGDFALAATSLPVPFDAQADDAIDLPVTFAPTMEGPSVGALKLTTERGTFSVPLTGVGTSSSPKLVVQPSVVTFGHSVIGKSVVQTVSVTNVGETALTISGVSPPAAPFSATGMPAAGTVMPPGQYFTITIEYTPTSAGVSSAYLGIEAGAVLAAVAVEGTAFGGGHLRVTPDTLDLGALALGDTAQATFRLINEGDLPVVIQKSKPPTSPAFQADAPFDEGTVIPPGTALDQMVRVSPVAAGPATDAWQLNADDGQGLRAVTFSVTGVEPSTASTAPAHTAELLPPSRVTEAPDEDAEGGCRVAGGRTGWPALAIAFALVLARRRRL